MTSLIVINLSLILLTSTTCSLKFPSTKIPTPFLSLEPPEYHNLNPSTSRALEPTHLVSWTQAIFIFLFLRIFTSSMDFPVNEPTFHDPTLKLCEPVTHLPLFSPALGLNRRHDSIPPSDTKSTRKY
ncbi:hypothetical protein KY284_012802 [Solanum tuberosum]|nr:hypothetical protein KY284_012802 [Solanum tuberosum]